MIIYRVKLQVNLNFALNKVGQKKSGKIIERFHFISISFNLARNLIYKLRLTILCISFGYFGINSPTLPCRQMWQWATGGQ